MIYWLLAGVVVLVMGMYAARIYVVDDVE